MRDGPSRYAEIEGTGADFLPRLKPYILGGRAIITAPHKIYGPQNNDVVARPQREVWRAFGPMEPPTRRRGLPPTPRVFPGGAGAGVEARSPG